MFAGQDAGRAAFRQQPAQPAGPVGDVLPQVRVLGFSVVLVFGLGRGGPRLGFGFGMSMVGLVAVAGPLVRAGVQAPAREARSLQPEFLTGDGQVRLRGLGHARAVEGWRYESVNGARAD